MHVIPKHRSGVTHHDSITLRHHVRRQLGEAVGFYRVHREVAQRARVGVVGVDEGVAGGDEKVGEGEEAVQVGGVGWGESPGGGREGRVEGEGVGQGEGKVVLGTERGGGGAIVGVGGEKVGRDVVELEEERGGGAGRFPGLWGERGGQTRWVAGGAGGWRMSPRREEGRVSSWIEGCNKYYARLS